MKAARMRSFRFVHHGITALVAVALVLSTAFARTYHVDPRGGGDAGTIQSTVAMASDGDTILLANGVYRGGGNRDVTFQQQHLTISSVSGKPDSCVLDCERQGRGFLISGRQEPRIQGITIANGHAVDGGAAYCSSHCSPRFSNCIFRGNQADRDGGAIRCADITEVVHVVNCTFAANSAGEAGGAVALCCCSLSRFESCTVVGNEAQRGSAFSCVGLSSLRLSRCIVAFHRGPAAFQCREGSCHAEVDSCDVFGNEGGDWEGCLDSLATQNGNVSVDPQFENAAAGDFRLRENSPVRAAGSSGSY